MLNVVSIMQHVLVVDDGSTDSDVTALLAGLDVVVLKHAENRGKGQAILTASRYVEEQGGRYMITIDADGQHYPRDIERFLPAAVGGPAGHHHRQQGLYYGTCPCVEPFRTVLCQLLAQGRDGPDDR